MRVDTQGGRVVILATLDGRSICVRYWAFPSLIADAKVPGAEVSIHEVGIIVVCSVESIENGDGLSLVSKLAVKIAHKDGVRVV